MKKFFKLFIAAFIAVTCIVPLQSISAAYGDPVEPIYQISRNDGGGKYGTHKNPDYKEGTTQYYRDGDIIEVDFRLPADSGVQIYNQVIKYDSDQLDLLSSDTDITGTLSSTFTSKNWSSTTARDNNDNEKILVYGGSNNFGNPDTKDYTGGTIAKVYFKVKNGVESTAGTPITFEFMNFQTAEFKNNKVSYTHIGYDPNNDAGTVYYTAPSQTIQVKKPSVTFSANDGFITQSQAKALNTKNDLKAYNDVSAKLTDGTNIDVTTDAQNFNDIKAGKIGSYDVTYGYTHDGNSDSKKVKLNVVSDDAVISPEKNFALSAEHAFITASDAKKLTNKTQLISLNNAKVTLKNGTNATPNVDAPAFASIQAGSVGTYEVTYSYGSGSDTASKKVFVTVVKDGSVISPNKDFSLYAKHGFIKNTEAKNLTSRTQLIPYNNAEVTLVNGDKRDPRPTVTAAEWLSITSGIKGSYNVLYEYGDGANETSLVVKITVIDENDPISPNKEASLSAQDVELSETEAKALTSKNDLIALNKASVTLSDGSVATPTIASVDYASIVSGKIGIYPITYTYGSGQGKVDKTVNVIVKEDKKHVITYEDKIITVDQAKALSSKDDLRVVNNVQVTAIDGSHPNAVVDAPTWSSIKDGKLGTYTVTYSYGYGDKLVSVNAKVTIVPNGSEIDDNASLYAQNGFLEQSSAKALVTRNDLIPYNAASVTLLSGGTATPTVGMSAGDWYLLSAGELGSYDVVYSYASLSKRVLATVIKDGSIVSEDKTASLYAENAFIESSNAKKLANKEALRAYNKASVTLIDGRTANATVDVAAADWLAIQQGTVGAYDILYTYGSGDGQVSKRVKIVVIDDDPIISQDGKVALNAVDGEIADTDAKKVTSKEDLIPYNSAKVTLEDGTIAKLDVTISTSSLNAIKAGTLGTYTVTYSYGSVGSPSYVSKTVKLEVVIKTRAIHMFDYDDNKRIDVIDLAHFNRIYSNSMNVSAYDLMLTDFNKDKRVDVIDLTQFKYYYSNSLILPPTVDVPVEIIP
ncbi:hypothetical protein M2475_000589 [Breznakia sp. PF5-3]|uniref:hypothetical protein n=1 Tax=unclassified Breznakia TaxID=2623764 RepID=UPI002406CDE9|nr:MULTISPECIES: hypothetical protein [unclassified Breznakia]MDF9824231.1 hypothetical protein [Breznakia sp. PM6-1]MDF9835029.1 hypothetical protein [Breznakia sp. PF5-3]MDF9837274.1 hypothetical protein [Breznakia sp. PFB2-8]MDF9859264.1 hypothetical protein [Breznakia sp. PH5-24]